jgi:caffeoyl-CoA O-methyltransferase
VDIIDPAVSDYLLTHCTPADDLLRDLAAETKQALPGDAEMQVSPDEGQFLTMITRMVGARRAVEVGTFTGYSSICIARGMPADGHLLACDVSEKWTSIARRYWQRAGLEDRIELRIGPAIDTLRALPAEPVLDLAFIDADKVSYPLYYEELVTRLRPGGLLLLDNVLLGGRVLNRPVEHGLLRLDKALLGGRVLSSALQAGPRVVMRQMNEIIVGDDRVESVMLPLRDGVTIARKR